MGTPVLALSFFFPPFLSLAGRVQEKRTLRPQRSPPGDHEALERLHVPDQVRFEIFHLRGTCGACPAWGVGVAPCPRRLCAAPCWSERKGCFFFHPSPIHPSSPPFLIANASAFDQRSSAVKKGVGWGVFANAIVGRAETPRYLPCFERAKRILLLNGATLRREAPAEAHVEESILILQKRERLKMEAGRRCILMSLRAGGFVWV